jgi:poly[(R)-3-hydroxyalkanoate] polymerase subunit PhaC
LDVVVPSKEMTNMTEKPSNGSQIVESWSKLVDDTMAGYPVEPIVEALAQAQHRPKEDPWVTLIDRLWDAHPLSNVVPIDFGEMLSVFQRVWLDVLSNPMRLWELSSDFVQQYTQLMTSSTLKLWGLDNKERKPVIEPEAGDKRFSAPDWQQNPLFDALKQSYLLTATTWLRAVDGIQGLDAKQQRKLTFILRQFLDAISPTNFAFTNPQVIHETMASGGHNLVKGMQHLLRDLKEGEIQITDTKAFQVGKDLAITPGQVVYRNQLIELIQYTPTTAQVHAIPILHMPPWVNKYYLLDLRPQNSLVKFLVDQGFTVFLISWKNPDAAMAEIGFDDYVSLGPVAALEVIKDITGSPKVNIAGYCIAGQMLAATLPYLAAKGDETVNAATFVVTLADFQAEVNDLMALFDESALRFAERQMHTRGVLGSREMATMFRMLRANDLIWSSVINNYLLGKESPAFDVLYWNNDGTRMTDKAHTFYLRNVCLENGLVKHGELVIKGVPIDARNIRQDVYAVGTQQDHLVPWKAAWRLTQLVGGAARFVLAGSGHVAGVLQPPSKGKGYWTNEKRAKSAAAWLEGATSHQGGWWADWLEWLKPRSGEMVAPPALGSAAYPPIIPAPGTYVFGK